MQELANARAKKHGACAIRGPSPAATRPLDSATVSRDYAVPNALRATAFPLFPLKRSSSQTFALSWYPYISQ